VKVSMLMWVRGNHWADTSPVRLLSRMIPDSSQRFQQGPMYAGCPGAVEVGRVLG